MLSWFHNQLSLPKRNAMQTKFFFALNTIKGKCTVIEYVRNGCNFFNVNRPTLIGNY